jgi:Tol biopolymer transport system component
VLDLWLRLRQPLPGMDAPKTERPDGGTESAQTNGRLDSWKDIASYLGRSVTAVQRWEQEEGLPVHRLPHKKKGSVFAFKHELDAWRTAKARTASRRTGLLQRVRDLIANRWAAAGLLIVLAVAAIVLIIRPPWTSAASAYVPMEPRPLANLGGEAGPSLSPDGTHVVYDWLVNGLHALYVKPVGGGSSRKLSTGPAIKFTESGYPKWSPRGDLIAFFAHDPDVGYALFVMAPSDGTPRRLTTVAGTGLCWNPDGRSIGFTDRTGAGEPFSIFSISLDTSERRRLTTPSATAFGDTFCSFSPSGRQLAVVRHASRHASDVYTIDLSGRQADDRRLTTGRQGMRGLEWSPDGETIVFASPSGLWSIRATETRQKPLLVAGVEGTAVHPSFSRTGPDGAPRLAYEYIAHDVNLWRWSRGANGAHTIDRIAGSVLWEDFPSLSPDGRRLAFVSNRSGEVAVWTADSNGNNPVQLTSHGPVSISPQWSPDGGRIVFASETAGNWDLYVIGADGTRSIRLTSDPSQEENPTWSRDGRWIYFRSDRSGVGKIWRMPSDGGVARPVTEGEASQAFEATDGKTLYFVRDDNAPGVWSMPTTGGREEFVVDDVLQNRWAVIDAGIAFMARPRGSRGRHIRLYDVKSKTIQTVAELADAEYWSGFTMTRDGSMALWPKTDVYTNHLMIIDRWRPPPGGS